MEPELSTERGDDVVMIRTLSHCTASHCFQALQVWKAALWAIGILMCMSAWAQELQPIPPYAPVVDVAGVLAPAEQAALAQKLMAFERAHGSELAVVLVATTKPEPIEDYANRLANTWKLGRQGIGDGVVLVIAVSDRASRIEVSRALEGAIPDLEAKRILQRHVTPSLRRGAFHEGIDKGLAALFVDIARENLPRPEGKQSASFEVPATVQASPPSDSSRVDAAQAVEHEPQGPSRSVMARMAVASAEYLFVALVLVSRFVWPVLIIWLLLKLPKARSSASSVRSDDDSASFSIVGNSGSNGDSSTDNSSPAASSGGSDYAGGGASDRW